MSRVNRDSRPVTSYLDCLDWVELYKGSQRWIFSDDPSLVYDLLNQNMTLFYEALRNSEWWCRSKKRFAASFWYLILIQGQEAFVLQLRVLFVVKIALDSQVFRVGLRSLMDLLMCFLGLRYYFDLLPSSDRQPPVDKCISLQRRVTLPLASFELHTSKLGTDEVLFERVLNMRRTLLFHWSVRRRKKLRFFSLMEKKSASRASLPIKPL